MLFNFIFGGFVLNKIIKKGFVLLLSTCLINSPSFAVPKNSDEVSTYQKSNISKEELDVCYFKKATPGKKTLLNLILTAVSPMGRAMYTWGGGWSASDAKAGINSLTIGIRDRVKEFCFSHLIENRKNEENDVFIVPAVDENGNPILKNGQQGEMFKYIYDGFDCSGFIGWVIYNTMETENNKTGYVMASTKMAKNFSERGWGELKKITGDQIKDSNYECHPGDIMSIKGHVYMSLGKCKDGSILLVHSSPPGVCIMGTTDKNGSKESDAIKLADKCNQKYKVWYEWYNKYYEDGFSRDINRYLGDCDQMVWYVDKREKSVLTDPDGVQKMSPEEIVGFILA